MTPNSERAHAAWQRLSKARFVMLTTIDADGGIYSCPMTLRQATETGALWFFTSTTTPTARAIERDPRAAVSLMGDDDFYVSVYGTASLVDDRDRMRELWDAMVKAWFPQGVEDPHLTLVRLDIERGEYWDADQNSMMKLFEIGKALAGGRRAQIGDKGTIEPADAAR